MCLCTLCGGIQVFVFVRELSLFIHTSLSAPVSVCCVCMCVWEWQQKVSSEKLVCVCAFLLRALVCVCCRVLVSVQRARPPIRQVGLQGEFTNTWPVSLTHLCGWRESKTRGRVEKEEDTQVVRGYWGKSADEKQRKRDGERRRENSWES